MSSSFSPYQTWLGLDESQSQPNYWDLLGLHESASDVKEISAAADRAAARVRRFRPGEHAREWAALLDQIAEAKKCLTDPQQRADYRRTLFGPASGSDQLQPNAQDAFSVVPTSFDPNLFPPGFVPGFVPEKASCRPAPQPPAIHAASPPAVLPAPQFAAPQFAVENGFTTLPAATREGNRVAGPLPVALSAVLTVSTIVAGTVFLNSPSGAPNPTAVTSADPIPSSPQPARRNPPSKSNQVPESTRGPSQPVIEPAIDSVTAAIDTDLLRTESALIRVEYAEPVKSETKATTVSPAAPAMTTAIMDEVPQPAKKELVKLGLAMQKARAAIGHHDFDKAMAFIAVAEEMPRLPEHQAMLDRLKLLAESVSQYRSAIQTSVGKLETGASFLVGEEAVGVVEVGPDKLIVRSRGRNRAYTLSEMPVGLAAALAAQTLTAEDPNTLALKGAYVLASPHANGDELKKAREFLEKAAATVAAAKDLLLLLQDQYQLEAAATRP